MADYKVTVKNNTIKVDSTTTSHSTTVVNPDYAVSLSRTGSQGTKGDSVSNSYLDGNGDWHIVITNSAGQTVQDINLGGSEYLDAAQLAANTAAAHLDTFEDVFLGAYATAPVTDNDGDPLTNGVMYYDTAMETLGIHNGSAWVYPIVDAETAATNAATSETNAATSEANALASATTASTAATNAEASATTASTAATNAGTSETNAAASESSASTSASNSATSAGLAATSAANAATSAGAASTSATAAQTAQTATEALLDQFDDVYLGAKAANPTTDNDGGPLAEGALYFNTTSDKLFIFDGTFWVDPSTNITANQVLTLIKGVDGSGSGLDADLLDGLDSTAFATAGHTHSNATISVAGFMSATDKTKLDGIEAGAQVNPTNNEILEAVKAVDGPGSGLNADFLDGLDSTSFAAASHTHTTSQILAFPEEVQDVVGGMVSGNAESGIVVTYDDINGKIDLDVQQPLGDLNDVADTASTDGETIMFDATGHTWVTRKATTDDISDIDNTGKADGAVLIYDSATGKYKASVVVQGGTF